MGWAVAFAGPYSDLNQALRASHSSESTAGLVEQAHLTHPPSTLVTALVEYRSGRVPSDVASRKIKSIVALAATAETAAYPVDASAQAKAIKRSPLFHDQPKQEANWLGRALENLLKWLSGLHLNAPSGPRGPSPSVLGSWLTFGMWGLLGIAALALGYFAFRHLSWRSALRRKAKAVLDEDEPDRTKDEWLEQADLLEREGRFREAVRCLYLACLLRFDESKVARFDRSQTNWEHLKRIEASPRLPSGFDFRTPTQAFDQIWYGFKSKGASDAAMFREWYTHLDQDLRSVPQ